MNFDENTIVSLIVVVGWIFSLCFHEFGHGVVAYIGGDKTIKDKGYLSFNPFAYTNVGLSIVLPAVLVLMGGIGLPGASVSVDHARLRGRVWESLVALAGPLFTLVFTVGLVFFIFSNPPIPREWLAGLTYLTVLEIVVMMFNLLPVPGLDGYGVIEPYLPAIVQKQFSSFSRYAYLILIAVLWMVPFANQLLWGTAYGIAFAIGLEPNLLIYGQSSFIKGAMPLSLTCIGLAIVVHLIKRRTETEKEQLNDGSDLPDSDAKMRP